jgi:hypothetical protein
MTRGEWQQALTDFALCEPSTAHVDMALANARLPDGDRRKLTPLHVISLRAAAECFDMGLLPGPETRAQLVDVLSSTAGAIEAILPPR